MKIPSNSGVALVCKEPMKHRVSRGFGFSEFQGNDEESKFWSEASDERKTELKKKHNDTGECLLCMIDELLPQKPLQPEKAPEPKPEEQKPEPLEAAPEIGIERPPKIVGGLIGRSIGSAEAATPNVKVSWAWYREGQGFVTWTFENKGTQQATVILSRNSYYFGNAFWPIYENNPGFNSPFAAKLDPLQNTTAQNNSPPLAVVSWKQEDGSYKSIIAFVFTLSPGQTWQMLEGGFSPLMPPENPSAYEVSEISQGDFTIGYDPKQVVVWDQQTGTSLQGYSPNPKVFQTVQVLAPSEAPFIELFEDAIFSGIRETPPQPRPEPEVAAEAQAEAPTQTTAKESKLWGLLARNRGK